MSRPHKRARRSQRDETPAVDMAINTDKKHAVFTSWAEKRGVEIHSVAPQQLPGRGLGLVTTAPIKEGSRILFVPEKAMFKPDATLCRKNKLERASPQAKLALSVLKASKAPKSQLSTWEATWPTNEDFVASMPLCWPDELNKYLPEGALGPLRRQRADYVKDWDAVKDVCNVNGWTEETWRYYWCIVNSRSFHWKPPAGRAGSMVLCPFIDYMNHAPTGGGCLVRQDEYGYEVVAQRGYEEGEEIYATYGGHSNDKLLIHYGFVCESTMQHASPDDEIRIDHVILPHLCEATKAQLQDVGFLGGYALLPAEYICQSRETDKPGAIGHCTGKCRQPWDICFKTQVAVRAELLTANEWEYFVSCGEDLSGDKSAAVDRWLLEKLERYIVDADAKAVQLKLRKAECLKDAETEGHDLGIAILETRWRQIGVASGNFIKRIPYP